MASRTQIPQELQRKIFELTLALYRVTDFFPPQEALCKRLREKANEIFGSVIEYGYSREFEAELTGIIARLQSMRGYLELARSLRFVKPINIAVLEREYDALIDFFESEFKRNRSAPENRNGGNSRIEESLEVAEQLQTWEEFSQETAEGAPVAAKGELKQNTHRVVPAAVPRKSNGINDRQKTIMEHLRTAQQAKISDFYSVFEGISSKTIQRDLQGLIVKDIIKKAGEKRWTVYSLKNVH